MGQVALGPLVVNIGKRLVHRVVLRIDLEIF